MFDRSCTRFHDKYLHKSGATFSLRRVESSYCREIRSSMVRKYKTKHKTRTYRATVPQLAEVVEQYYVHSTFVFTIYVRPDTVGNIRSNMYVGIRIFFVERSQIVKTFVRPSIRYTIFCETVARTTCQNHQCYFFIFLFIKTRFVPLTIYLYLRSPVFN